MAGLVPLGEEEEKELPLFTLRGCSKKVAISERGKQSSPVPSHTGTLMSNIQPPKLWEINFCSLSHPVKAILLKQLQWIKEKPYKNTTEEKARWDSPPGIQDVLVLWLDAGNLIRELGSWLASFLLMCLVTQSCLILSDPMLRAIPSGSSVHGIFQARILE